MRSESGMKEPAKFYWERDGWQPVSPVRNGGDTSPANNAFFEAEQLLLAELKSQAEVGKAEVKFFLKGDVARSEGLHLVPNSNLGYKAKISVKLVSGQTVERGFTWDSCGNARLNDDV